MRKYEINHMLENKNDRQKYIGKILESNNCGKFKILGVYDIAENGSKNYVVEFVDTKYQTVATYLQIRNLRIKDNYYPSVYNIGYIGDYEGKVSKNKYYTIWHSMIQRCYGSKDKLKTYNNVKISKEWHNFTNFANDIEKLIGYDNIAKYPNIKFELDKDILSDKNNKIYSKETCCFIPHALNMFFVGKKSRNAKKYKGVYYNYKLKTFVAHANFEKINYRKDGFHNPLDAYVWYYNAKKAMLQKYFKEDFSFVDSRIKNAMIEKLYQESRDAEKIEGKKIDVVKGYYY